MAGLIWVWHLLFDPVVPALLLRLGPRPGLGGEVKGTLAASQPGALSSFLSQRNQADQCKSETV